MAFRHLKFFDKEGYNATPVLQDGIFKINLNFDRVSTGLFETQHLFIFEEVFAQLDSTAQVVTTTKPSTPFAIQILRYLRDFNGSVSKTMLGTYFPTLTIKKDYINEFVQRQGNNIEHYFVGDEEYYTITSDGIEYVNRYDEEEREYELQGYGLETSLTRPRSSYFQKPIDSIDEYFDETYFFFKWKKPNKYDRNIFLYFLDYNPNLLYQNNRESLCLESDEKYPNIIPLYSKYLNPDSTTNPNWKTWFRPYTFDNGKGDDFEWNQIPEYNQSGAISTSDGYDEFTDISGNTVFQGRRILSNTDKINNKPFQFNFALHSEVEGIFDRTLELYAIKSNRISYLDGGLQYKTISNSFKIAEINIHGEVVAEDERLKKLLENFGRKVDESEVYIFRDSDVDEERPDYIKINEKRKELMLVGEDIFPYLGSYKAFVNALKFFGFHDLKLKEYFINILLSYPEYGIYSYTGAEIPLDLQVNDERLANKEFNELVYGDLVDDNVFYKTSRFGLVYNLNECTGEYDDDGWPIVEDVYDYTNEDILIKLYGLKKVLEDRYLPHHVRIIDITGEGIYFAKYKISTWQDLTPIYPLKWTDNPEFVAKPRKGYIKPLDRLLNLFRRSIDELNDLGYYDKDGNYINEGINQFTVLENIIHNSLYEFIKGGRIDFPFDKEVPKELILKHYPDYWELKKAIFNHLKNSKCEDDYTLADVSKSIFHGIKMLGQPVVLKLLDDIITWDDLPVRYEYHENDFLNTIEKMNETWDGIGKLNKFKMTWNVRHIDDKYCWSQTDLVKNIREVVIFLPAIGFYDVSCIVQDMNNFPRMTKKKKYIEVLKKAPEFIAFGRFVKDKSTINENTTTWKEFEGTWELGNYCPLKTTWNDAKINWDSLQYQNYLRQDFTADYKTCKILDIDETSNRITLAGPNFYFNHQNYSEQKWRDNIIIEKSPKNTPYRKNVDVNEVYAKTIELKGKWNVLVGDKINLYKYFNSQNFVINGDEILISTVYSDAFEIDHEITLYESQTNTPYYYNVKDIWVDYVNEQIKLVIENDGSLELLPFNRIEYRGDDYLFKVTGVRYDSSKNITFVTVTDKYHHLEYARKKILKEQTLIESAGSVGYYGKNTEYGWKVEWGIMAGYFVFDIFNVELINNNSVVRLEPNLDICNIDIRFEAKYNIYDVDWVVKHGTSEKYEWCNLDNVTFDQTANQTWDMTDYHGNTLLGFKLTQYRDSGYIYFDEQKFEYDIQQYGINEKWYYLAKQLNTSTLKKVRIFNYYVIENRFIQAVAKSPSITSLVDLKYSRGTVGTPDSYPRYNFKKFSEEWFPGDNNPAIWSPIKRIWELNNSKFNYINSNSKVPFTWACSGAFNFSDTFISYKDMTLPEFTTVFIVFDKNNEITQDTIFDWELWEETRNKLVMKSNYNYLIFNFIDRGVYSVKLTIKDDQNNSQTYEKKSWIYIK